MHCTAAAALLHACSGDPRMRCVDVAAAAHALLAPRGPSSATYDRSLHALLHWIPLPSVFWSVWEALVIRYPTQVESGQSELPFKIYCRLNISLSVCFLGQAVVPPGRVGTTIRI